jgi:hypothetical protein
MTIACRTRRRPTEATTLARIGARRSGRKISTWMSSPKTMQNASESTSAGQKPIAPPSDTVVGRSGRSSESPAVSRSATPSTNASGLGSGGRNRSPSERKPAYR